MNAVWDGWVAPGQPPARATVESRLASPDYLVEIMVEAAVDDWREGGPTTRGLGPIR